MNLNLIEEAVINRAGQWIPRTDINMALVVVDMLNDGCRGGGAFEKMGFDIRKFYQIEPAVAQLAEYFKSKNWPIFYVVSYYDCDLLPAAMSVKLKSLLQSSINLCSVGTWGAQLVDSLPPINNFIVMKSHFSCFAPGYSACILKESFDDYSMRNSLNVLAVKDLYMSALSYTGDANVKARTVDIRSLPLESVLRSMSIDTIVLTGGSTHVCLASAAYSAFDRGFQLILPIDAIASEDIHKHWTYLHNLMLFSAEVTSVNRLVTHLNKLGAPKDECI